MREVRRMIENVLEEITLSSLTRFKDITRREFNIFRIAGCLLIDIFIMGTVNHIW